MTLQFRLSWILAVIAMAGVGFAVAAIFFRPPPPALGHLQLAYQTSAAGDVREVNCEILLYEEGRPRFIVSFRDRAPFGEVDVVTVEDARQGTQVSYCTGPYMRAMGVSNPPVTPVQQERYRRLREFFAMRLDAEQRRDMDELVKFDVPNTEKWPPTGPRWKHTVRLDRSVLNTARNGEDFEYWLIPPDLW